MAFRDTRIVADKRKEEFDELEAWCETMPLTKLSKMDLVSYAKGVEITLAWAFGFGHRPDNSEILDQIKGVFL